MKLAELKGIQIFATGTHRGKLFAESDLDKIIENFKKFGDAIQPPMVLGHDENQQILQNSGLPSLGWVTSLSKERDGDVVKLIADFENVPESAIAAINSRRYRRISSEIYENFADDKGETHGMALRRVGLLGADIPEVKTLDDVVALTGMTGVILLTDLEGTEKKGGSKGRPGRRSRQDGGGSAEEYEERIVKMEEENAILKKQNQEIGAEMAKGRVTANRNEIASFCEARKREGKYLPKWDEMGLQKFMEGLDSDKVMKFAEKGKPTSSFELFKEFLNAMPDLVKMKEQAASGDPDSIEHLKRGAGTEKVTGVALDVAVQKYIEEQGKAGKTVEYIDALKHVSKVQPDLVE